MGRALSLAVVFLLVLLPLGVGGSTLLQFPAFPQELVQQLQWQSWLQSAFVSFTFTVGLILAVCYLSLWLGQRITAGSSSSRIAPLLAVPHAALAVGLMVLLSPSGWLVRLVHSLFELFPSPPAHWWLADKSLVTMAIVLIIKELPFLLLMIAAQRDQLPIQRWQTQAQSMGYSERRCWWLVVVPALLPRLKFPLFAIAIYTLSVVDIALMVGPNTPPLLAPRAHEASLRFTDLAAAEAWLGQWLLIVLGALLFLGIATNQAVYRRLSLNAIGRPVRYSVRSIRSGFGNQLLLWLCGLAVLALIVQSVAGAWFYPALLPQQWSLERWMTDWPYAWPLLQNSLWLAVVSAAIGVAGALLVLERQRSQRKKALAWLPLLLLLIPQLPIVLGWQRALGQDAGWLWVLWSHTAFTFPYAYLVMHGAYNSFPSRWLYQAQSLGHAPLSAWFSVLLPQIRGSVALAFAVGAAVSIAQYLPTLWLAGVDYPTLTTETVSLAAGGDWRMASIYALLQTLIPVVLLIWASRQGNEQRWKRQHVRN